MADLTTDPLTQFEWRLVRHLVERVRREVPAELVQASLFGSTSRGEARPDSDIDVLLVFRSLPPDREPHATHAERIAEDVAHHSGVPVSVWCVSLPDLQLGVRTPMLVDALADSIPIWCHDTAVPPVSFTILDALNCGEALLDRVEEGSEEFTVALHRGDPASATRRGRDDLVRLCTAFLLLRGLTRPRRADAIRAFLHLEGSELGLPREIIRVLDWAISTFGPTGRHQDAPIAPPRAGLASVISTIDWLRARLIERGSRIAVAAGPPAPPRE